MKKFTIFILFILVLIVSAACSSKEETVTNLEETKNGNIGKTSSDEKDGPKKTVIEAQVGQPFELTDLFGTKAEVTLSNFQVETSKNDSDHDFLTFDVTVNNLSNELDRSFYLSLDSMELFSTGGKEIGDHRVGFYEIEAGRKISVMEGGQGTEKFGLGYSNQEEYGELRVTLLDPNHDYQIVKLNLK